LQDWHELGAVAPLPAGQQQPFTGFARVEARA
jgi:hypothetical protein